MMPLFDLQGKRFTPLCLKGADLYGRDVVFQGATLAKFVNASHEFVLYHTQSQHPDEHLVMTQTERATGKVEARVMGVNDTDELEDMLGLDVMYEVCRQSQFPGFNIVGSKVDA